MASKKNDPNPTPGSHLPPYVRAFEQSYPAVWEAFEILGEECHHAGPLDEKTRRLVKVALALAAGLEGGTHSAVRNARAGGVTQAELEHVAVLAITTLGFPATMRGLTWLGDVHPAGSKRGTAKPKGPRKR